MTTSEIIKHYAGYYLNEFINEWLEFTYEPRYWFPDTLKAPKLKYYSKNKIISVQIQEYAHNMKIKISKKFKLKFKSEIKYLFIPDFCYDMVLVHSVARIANSSARAPIEENDFIDNEPLASSRFILSLFEFIEKYPDFSLKYYYEHMPHCSTFQKLENELRKTR